MSNNIVDSANIFLDNYHHLKHKIKDPANTSIVSGTIGAIGAVISRTVVSPFERAKILLQLQGPGLQQAYNGMFATILKMYRDEGYKGWFRGNILNCVRIFPYSGIQFYVFEMCKNSLLLKHPRPSNELNSMERIVSASMGGFFSVLFTYPLDLIRARITIQTASLNKLEKARLTKPPTVIQTGVDVYKNEGGFLALYKGLLPTTLGVVPYVSINFCLYEQMREYMNNSAKDFSNPLWKLSAGATSSFIGGVLIYPLDVLRKRYQVASMGGGELGFQYRSVWHALTSMFKQEGFLGAYKGLTANLYKIVPSMAVHWLCYDLMRDFVKSW